MKWAIDESPTENGKRQSDDPLSNLHAPPPLHQKEKEKESKNTWTLID